MAEKRTKKLKAVDHSELNIGENELVNKKTHAAQKDENQSTKKGCCKMHTLIRCALGTLAIAALLKYLDILVY